MCYTNDLPISSVYHPSTTSQTKYNNQINKIKINSLYKTKPVLYGCITMIG